MEVQSTFYTLKGRNVFNENSKYSTFTLKMEPEEVLDLYKPSIDDDSSSYSAVNKGRVMEPRCL